MFDSGSYVARDLAHQQRMRRLLMQQKRGLPKGRLTTTKINGRLYYYRVVDGKKEYLGTGENEIVLKLQKKYFIEETVKRIDKNCKYMDKLIAGYASVDPEDIMEAAPRAYQSLPKSCFTMVGINNQRGGVMNPTNGTWAIQSSSTIKPSREILSDQNLRRSSPTCYL